ncbi:MAG TPA: aminotransferase class V-fold PLP-dependent enzyme [Gemmatimonadaceae bacterium]|nr:aminotransferase class V-fold PLP-dependent enzyme [Gemmatimonadaceae bacterium]
MINLEELRRAEFPWTGAGKISYLNHAGTGPLPARTVRALSEWDHVRSEPWRNTAKEQFGVLARSRELCARIIGASPDEIAMTVNTGYGINLAASSIALKPGDVIVTPDREFPANVYPWMALAARQGLTYRRVPHVNGLADEDALITALDEPNVKVLSVSWVSFETGLKLDLARLGAACRARGITFVVDAIQGIGAASIDVRACHIDFLACGGQKWLLSPWGTGFLYVRRELIEGIIPQPVSWMAVKNSEDFTQLCNYELNLFDSARRFEMITLPYQEFAGLNASLELFESVGWDRVYALVNERATQVVEWAERRRDVTLVTPADPARRAGVIAVRPANPVEASARLHANGVPHALREGMLRLAPHFYITAGEVDRALGVLS